jgi:hypothetical protein
MKDLLSSFGKKGKKVLLVGMLAPALAACGHTIDPTRSQIPTYDMPAAVVVQTPPVQLQGRYGIGGVPVAAGPQYVPRGQFAAQPLHSAPNTMVAPGTGYQATPSATMPQTMARSDGSTVIQQSPITVQRPSIVVPQQPVWVGNPPMPIPQPPVVINQPPVVYQQPSVVVRPPQIEFGPPVSTAPVMIPPPVTGMPMQPQSYPQSSQYQQHIPMAMAAPVQPNRMTAPSTVTPTRQGAEDYLPPK